MACFSLWVRQINNPNSCKQVWTSAGASAHCLGPGGGLTVVSVLAYVLFVSSWSRLGMQGAASAFQNKLLCQLVSALGRQHRAHSYLDEKLLGPGAGFGRCLFTPQLVK